MIGAYRNYSVKMGYVALNVILNQAWATCSPERYWITLKILTRMSGRTFNGEGK